MKCEGFWLCPACGKRYPHTQRANCGRTVFPAGGASVGEKNLRVGQPGHSRIMDKAMRDVPNQDTRDA